MAHEQSPCRAEQVVLLLTLGEAKQLGRGLTWCHIEAICELPAMAGPVRALRAGSAAGCSEGGEHRAVLGTQGTDGGLGRGHGAHQERSLPVGSARGAWERREQSISQEPAPALICIAPTEQRGRVLRHGAPNEE